MANGGEGVAGEYGRSGREGVDSARRSYSRALGAMDGGKFAQEIVPVEISSAKGAPQLVAEDEEPRRVDFDKLSTLRPAFEEGGTVTAGNASSISDGAAAVVLAAEDVAQRRGWKPLARIVGQAGAAMAPEWFTIAPAQATKRLLEKVGWRKEDVDLFEINEAFSAVVLGVCRDPGLSLERVNVHSGAGPPGHPLGGSGARVPATPPVRLPPHEARRGVGAICLAGREAVAVAGWGLPVPRRGRRQPPSRC